MTDEQAPESVPARYWDGLEALITKESLKLRGSFEPEGGPHAREPDVVKWFFDQAKRYDNPVVLDIGACTGSYALLSKFHDMQIHSFEPTPRTFKQLEANVKLNELEEKTKVYPWAMGGHPGRETFHVVVHDSCAALSMLGGKPASHKEVKQITVNVTTVDQFCANRDLQPKLIKIDTEGNELAVLEGALYTIDTLHPTILCEYSRPNTLQYGYNPEEIFKLLKRKGYKCRVDGPELFAVWER